MAFTCFLERHCALSLGRAVNSDQWELGKAQPGLPARFACKYDVSSGKATGRCEKRKYFGTNGAKTKAALLCLLLRCPVTPGQPLCRKTGA